MLKKTRNARFNPRRPQESWYRSQEVRKGLEFDMSRGIKDLWTPHYGVHKKKE